MDAEPRKISRPSRSSELDPEAAPGRPRERFGTVALERHLKDDGRALILYARSELETA
jgi:hypothetical protein